MQVAEGETAVTTVDPLPVEDIRSRRRPVGFYVAVAWIVLIVGAAIFADVLPIADPLENDPSAGRAGPSWDHLLGGDQLGRDLLSRSIYGARISILVGVVATAFGGAIGTTLGLISGYFRRGWEVMIMGGIDVLLAFPALILAIALASFLGPSVRNVIIAIGVLVIPTFARVVRAQTLSLSERDFVKASKAVGSTNRRIIVVELLPNVLPTVLTYSLIVVALAIVVEGALSFLGVGVPPPTPTWGGMIDDGRGELRSSPHMTAVPAVFMFFTVLAFNTVGERLRGRLDIRSEGNV